MKLVRVLLTNHPLVNILFVVVLIMGFVSYAQICYTFVEVSFREFAKAHENIGHILSRATTYEFNVVYVSQRIFQGSGYQFFDKRVTDLRREIQSKSNDELPDEVDDPYILEITTSNGFPTAMVVVAGQADDERLRRQGKLIKEELERIPGVDQVQAFGFNQPELQVEVNPRALHPEV